METRAHHLHHGSEEMTENKGQHVSDYTHQTMFRH
jgi:hypothetical protein